MRNEDIMNILFSFIFYWNNSFIEFYKKHIMGIVLDIIISILDFIFHVRYKQWQ